VSLEDAPLPNTKKEKARRKRKHGVSGGRQRKNKMDDDERPTGGQSFEEVPVASDFSSDSDAAAEAMAIGAQFLRKRSREDVIDAGYNRTRRLFVEILINLSSCL
jgi:hypothetical protein